MAKRPSCKRCGQHLFLAWVGGVVPVFLCSRCDV
jgi:ribosomal protein S27AE